MKTIEQKYKRLDEISHVLARPGRYVGSTKPHTAMTYVLDDSLKRIIKKEITWNPALLKLIDEVISNCVDESKEKNSKLDKINITIDQKTGEISIKDNGGIPVVIHKEENKYLPELLFGELRSGSNFNDEDETQKTGQNGEGSTLVNIFSKKYKIETCDGKKKFTQTFYENLSKRTEPKIKPSTTHFTEISWIPDYERLESTLDEGNYLKIVKRIHDICGCNPKLKISLNGKRIIVNSFKDYIQLYTDEFIYEDEKNWRIGVSSSNGNFEHISFVNGENTVIGGTHIEYISYQLIVKLREFFKKKHKVDVKPGEIKNHITLFIDSNIVKPRYSSQTKDELITEVKEYQTSIQISDKFINKIINSPIIQDVLDWVEAKKHAQEQAELRKLNKDRSKLNPRKIVKFSDANEKKDRSKCILFLTEGDSAGKAINAAADRMTMGSFPLKGKPINVNDVDMKKLILNAEFANIMTIMGLQIGVRVENPKDLYFGKLAVMADADTDGSHIIGLLINMIHTFWPELFEYGMIYRFKTPLIKAKMGKQEFEFFLEEEFRIWKEKNSTKKFTSKYFKGLGTSKTADFKGYLSNLDEYLIPLEINDDKDTECIDLAFNKKRAGDRKVWLGISNEF